MWKRDLPVVRVDDALRVVRALGKHRYVAGRMHFVHALAAADVSGPVGTWARGVLADDAIDKASRDERLLWRASEDDVCAILARFWDESTRGPACDALLERLEAAGVGVAMAEPFGADEDDVFPLLVDAGFELLPLAELDQARHRGAIEAYSERIHYEVACFEEREHVPRVVHLQELPVLGACELVRGARDGELVDPLSLWLSGDETYQDYVVRGVLRAAKVG